MAQRRRSEFDEFCERAFDLLDGAQVRHLVIGGLAVIAVGEPRTTADVDVLAFVTDDEARSLVLRAIAEGFDADAAVEAKRLETTGTLRLRYGPFQLDVITASLPFEESAYRRSTRSELFGRTVTLPTPEDLLLFKVLAGRDKDLLDSVGVIRRHAQALDWAYVETVIRDLCELAEDMAPWRRLEEVRRKAAL